MMRTEALCSQGNYCSAFAVLLSHTVIALIVIAIVPLRYNSTISCFNQANQLLYKRRHKKNIAITNFTLIPFTFSILLKIVISNIGFHIKEPELYYPYNLAYFGPIIIINVIGVLCHIGEQSFKDINQELEQLCGSDINRYYRLHRIKILMEDHWYTTNFLENISNCFAVDTFLIMIDIYIQLVLFLYVTLWSMFAQKVFFGHPVWPHAAGLLEVMIITVKLIYLCYRCDRAVAKVSKTANKNILKNTIKLGNNQQNRKQHIIQHYHRMISFFKGNFTLFYLRHLSAVTSHDFDTQHVVSTIIS